MALMEAGFTARGLMTRSQFLDSMSADLALDVCYVAMTRMLSSNGRTYSQTRAVVEKVSAPPAPVKRGLSDSEAVRRSVVSMAKYRKG